MRHHDEPEAFPLHDRQLEAGIPFRQTSVFPKFEEAVRSGGNPITIALMFNIDHTTVLYWKRRFGLSDEGGQG